MTDEPTPGGRRLAIGYYVDNFLTITRDVRARYGDLLSEAESAVIARFEAASLGAQRLYVRLISRKGSLFRRDKLDYPEVEDVDAAIAELEALELLDDGRAAELDEWVGLLRVPELRDIAARRLEPAPPRSLTRGPLVQRLEQQLGAAELRAEVQGAVRAVRTRGLEVVALLRLLFFGNLSQDLTEFVLQDLGMLRFEDVPLSVETRLFRDRGEVEASFELLERRSFIELLLREDELDEALALGRGVIAIIPRLPERQRRRADAVLNGLARELERAGRGLEALELYTAALEPPARERRARIHIERGELAEARALLEEVVADPRDETEREVGPRLLNTLRKAAGEAPLTRRRASPRELLLALEQEPSRPIEAQCLAALAGQGIAGLHSENWLWRALFGLALWDIIFAPLPGAFQHRFQRGPSDLNTAAFARRRRALLEARWEELRGCEDVAARLLSVYDAKQGLANAFVPWEALEREALERILARVDGASLAVILERMSRHIPRNSRGLPDLLVLPGEGFELIEVKGPGDQLRPEQRGWLAALAEAGVPVWVLRVVWL